MVLCSMLAAVENTHRPEQMAAEKGDRLTDENCRGYPTWEFSQAEREKEANLTLKPPSNKEDTDRVSFSSSASLTFIKGSKSKLC